MATVADEKDERGGIGTILRLPVELWLVVLMMALAFGAGIVVTALYEDPQPTPAVGFQDPTGQLPVAPPLTDEQIQGGLPSGHPDLGGDGVTGATGAGAGNDAEAANGAGGDGG